MLRPVGEIIEKSRNAILQFSGGKDSTALIHLVRPWLDRITVVFAETGATFPHLVRHIEQTCKRLGAKLTIVCPPVDVFRHTRDHGLPSDVVPVEASSAMRPFLNPPAKQILQPYTQCCGAMLWEPLLKYTRDHEVDLVLRGSKKADHRVGVGPNVVVEGVTYESPLWDWTDDDVYAYLKEQDAPLPDHYSKINDSLDCWMCTAHLAHHGDEKMRYIRENYPGLWPVVSERMGRVRTVLATEMTKIIPALEVSSKG